MERAARESTRDKNILLKLYDNPVSGNAYKVRMMLAHLGLQYERIELSVTDRSGRYSVADICLYGYTHMADQAGIDLAAFPAVAAWVARVAAQPGHVVITD